MHSLLRYSSSPQPSSTIRLCLTNMPTNKYFLVCKLLLNDNFSFYSMHAKAREAIPSTETLFPPRLLQSHRCSDEGVAHTKILRTAVERI